MRSYSHTNFPAEGRKCYISALQSNYIIEAQEIYTYKLRRFVNKLRNPCTRLTAYTFGIQHM